MADELKRIVETAGKTVAGIVGTAAGLAAGTAEALVGKARSEPRTAEPANEELYWREHFAAEPYVEAAYQFEDYLPAWRTGWEGRASTPDTRSTMPSASFSRIGTGTAQKACTLLWDQGRPAVRAAFERATAW